MCVGKIPEIGNLSENSWKDKILYCLDQIYWLLRRPSNLQVAVIGPEDCGKTSVIRRFAGDIFYEEKHNPIDNVFKLKTLLRVDNQLRRFNTEIIEMPHGNILNSKYGGITAKATGYVLVYDANSPYTYQELSVFISRLQKGRKHKLPPIVVVGNKSEKCTDMKQVNHNIEIQDDVQASGIKYFSTSAQLNSGIYEAFDEIMEQCAHKKVWSLPFRKRPRQKSTNKKNNEECLLSEEVTVK